MARDFKLGQLPAGAQGPKGDTGARGAQGEPGISGLQRVSADSVSNSDSYKIVVAATCPAGKRAISSGAVVNGGLTGNLPNVLTDVVIDAVVPTVASVVPGRVLATAVEEEPTSDAWSVSAYAMCANAS